MEVLSKAGNVCRIKLHDGMKFNVTNNGAAVNVKLDNDGSTAFGTMKGGVYVLEVK